MKGASFKARVKERKIVFERPGDLEILKQDLEGEEILVRIDKWYKLRTNPQLKYYYGVIVTILMEFSGHDKEDIHTLLKAEHLPKIDVMGKEVSSTTTNMSTADFEKYTSKIRMWASRDLQVYIPEPNEAPSFAYDVKEALKDTKTKINLDE